LDFHATQLFKAKQEKFESVSEWVQRIQTLGFKFREAGILTLSDKLRNICFIQGLFSDRIQTIFRNQNHDDFDGTAEMALEEVPWYPRERDTRFQVPIPCIERSAKDQVMSAVTVSQN
jgi:hypothetical protein